MVEGTALEKRQAGNPGARVQIPPSPFILLSDLILKSKELVYTGSQAPRQAV